MSKLLKPRPHWIYRIFSYDVTYDVPLAICGAAGAGLASFRFFTDSPPQIAFGLFSATVVGLNAVFLIGKAVKKHIESVPSPTYNPLEAILHSTYSTLTDGPSIAPDTHGLRMCVFVPKGDETVHQITNYVGVNPPYGAGRDMSSAKGIVGKVARAKKPGYDFVRGQRNRIEYLVDVYGYTKQEAMELRQDSMSWAAVPVEVDGVVLALIFADTAQKNFWCPNRIKILDATVIGVVQYLQRN